MFLLFLLLILIAKCIIGSAGFSGAGWGGVAGIITVSVG
jgi:hypothetical protein